MDARISPIFSRNNSIFIGNLDMRVTKKDLQNALMPYAVGEIRIRKIPQYESSYAFVTISIPMEENSPIDIEDPKSIIEKLKECDMHLYQRRLHFSIITSKLTSSEFGVYLENEHISDKSFDLAADDPEKPCVHLLFDDIMLHILNFLEMDDIYCLGKVCKRFQYLVGIVCTTKLKKYNGGCFKTWLFRNNIQNTYLGARGILKYAGHIIKKMEIHEEFKDLQWTIFLISEFCPNLEELAITGNSSIQTNYMVRLGNMCPHLKKLVLKCRNTFTNRIFHSIFTKNRSLEVLQVHSKVEITRRCFRSAPYTLKELTCTAAVGKDQVKQRMSHWKKLFVACRQLEVLHLNGIMTLQLLKDAASYCPHMKELWLKMDTEVVQFNWSLFSQLKKLVITTQRIDLNTLASNSLLQDLSINTEESRQTEVIGNFAQLKGLKNLTVNIQPLVNDSVLRSIAECVDLEFLELNVMRFNLETVLFCIESLPKLTELLCKSITIRAADIRLLVDAHRGQQKKLKLTIGVDASAFENIENLHEANYEVNVLDVDNLFVFDIDELQLPFDV